MILTKNDIDNLREKSFLNISEKQEKEILELLATEPDDTYVWSEQVIFEHIRKIIQT